MVRTYANDKLSFGPKHYNDSELCCCCCCVLLLLLLLVRCYCYAVSLSFLFCSRFSMVGARTSLDMFLANEDTIKRRCKCTGQLFSVELYFTFRNLRPLKSDDTGVLAEGKCRSAADPLQRRDTSPCASWVHIL